MVSMRFTLVAAAVASLAAPASAQPYRTGGPYMGPMYPPRPDYGPRYGARDPREGKVEAIAFAAASPNVARLGHGSIVLTSTEGGLGSAAEDATYESALVDQLAKAGYQTAAQPNLVGQTVEFAVSREVIQPPEPPHSPVGGAVSAGVGSHGWGGGVGIGLNIDLSKPLKALVATRLQARIRDSVTHELLWEGRAQIATREGDKHWNGPALAAKLSAALFKGFPQPTPIAGH